MSKNDEIVLQANFKQWKGEQGTGLNGFSPWLYYCVQQFVKPFMPDDEEIRDGITDGGNDGGADAIFIVANQRQILSQTASVDEKSISKIRVIFIQVKESGGFKPTEIEKNVQLVKDFFDLSTPANSYGARYNENIVRIMGLWKTTRIKIAAAFPEYFIDFYYVTGDDADANDYALDSGKRVKNSVLELDPKATCEFHFVGAAELWEQVQQRAPRSKTLIWSGQPMNAKDGTVGLVNIRQYYEFLDDGNGVLAERFFESNVRGYQQDVAVNQNIAAALGAGPDTTNFWLLNNGVTIITPKAQPQGFQAVEIMDPQIVNGLQTSREIFNHFSKVGEGEDSRSVLVRVIETKDENTQSQIIRATNSQNRMQASQLRMTDQIHRDIEEVFKKSGFYYDRRKGFYKDQGRPSSKIISVNEVVQATIAILLGKPNDARARPGDYFKTDERYTSIFGDGKFPLDVYLYCVILVRDIEKNLRERGIARGDINNLKYYVACSAARELTGVFMPPPALLLKVKGDRKVAIDWAFSTSNRIYGNLSAKSDRDTVARGTTLATRLADACRRRLKQKTKKV